MWGHVNRGGINVNNSSTEHIVNYPAMINGGILQKMILHARHSFKYLIVILSLADAQYVVMDFGIHKSQNIISGSIFMIH